MTHVHSVTDERFVGTDQVYEREDAQKPTGTDGAQAAGHAPSSPDALDSHDINVRLLETAALRDVLLRRRIIVNDDDR